MIGNGVLSSKQVGIFCSLFASVLIITRHQYEINVGILGCLNFLLDTVSQWIVHAQKSDKNAILFKLLQVLSEIIGFVLNFL